MTLIGAKRPQFVDRGRRDFLIRFCQGAGATLLPSQLWNFAARAARGSQAGVSPAEFRLHPRYRSERPLDSVLQKVPPGSDGFIHEKYAAEVEAILARWGTELLADWQAAFGPYAKIEVADFQVTRIEATGSQSNSDPLRVQTRVRYEIVGAGAGFHRQQQVGNWRMTWESPRPGEFLLMSMGVLDQTRARSTAPLYSDITASALGGNAVVREPGRRKIPGEA